MRYRRLREYHVVNFLTYFGPKSSDELRESVPGNVEGDPVAIAERLIHEGRLDPSLLSDYQQSEVTH